MIAPETNRLIEELLSGTYPTTITDDDREDIELFAGKYAQRAAELNALPADCATTARALAQHRLVQAEAALNGTLAPITGVTFVGRGDTSVPYLNGAPLYARA